MLVSECASHLKLCNGALQQVWEEEENPALGCRGLSADGEAYLACTDGSCSVPSKEQWSLLLDSKPIEEFYGLLVYNYRRNM